MILLIVSGQMILYRKWEAKDLNGSVIYYRFSKKKPEAQLIPQQIGRRFVKDTEVTIEDGKISVDELHVELLPDQPDEMARVIARSFRTRKTIAGNYNLKTREFEIKDTD